MIVSSGIDKTYNRIDRVCEFRINGSYINIWFKYGGDDKFVSLEASGLMSFLENNKNCTGLITIDEPANHETATNEYFKMISKVESAKSRSLKI